MSAPLIIVVVLAVLGIGGYFVLVKNNQSPQPASSQTTDKDKLKTYTD